MRISPRLIAVWSLVIAQYNSFPSLIFKRTDIHKHMGYEKSKIYKLVCEDGFYYYGSTTSTLSNRLSKHKTNSRIENSKLYTHIKTIGWDKVNIQLIEQIQCESRQELLRKENEYILSAKDDNLCLNTIRAHVNPEQRIIDKQTYRENTRDSINERARVYREQNKEKIKESMKTWYNNHKEECSNQQKQYQKDNKDTIKEHRKQFYDENKERLLKEKKEYYELHKDEINKKRREARRKKQEEQNVFSQPKHSNRNASYKARRSQLCFENI